MYTLSDIINELLIEMDYTQNNRFAQFYQFGVSYLRRVNLDTSGFPKIVDLHVSHNDTANLPNDYIQYTKIGLCVNGQMISLGLNNNICLDQKYNQCGIPVSPHNGNQNGFGWDAFGSLLGIGNPMLFADTTRNGEALGRLFGAGSDNNIIGQYRIDLTNRQIKFSGLKQSCAIVLEYLADITGSGDDFEVHPFMIESCKDYIFWKIKQRSSKPLGEQQIAHQDFKISHRLMQQRFMSSTLEEWTAAFESCNKQTPKLGGTASGYQQWGGRDINS